MLRVDPGSGEATASEELCEGLQGLAVAGWLLWTACPFSDQVVGLDPDTPEVVHEVTVAGAPDPLVTAPDGTLLVVPEQGSPWSRSTRAPVRSSTSACWASSPTSVTAPTSTPRSPAARSG